MSRREEGRIKFFKTDGKWGFITRNKGGECFFHETDLKHGGTPKKNDRVTFKTAQNEKGLKAVEIVLEVD